MNPVHLLLDSDISNLAVYVHPARSHGCPCRVSKRELCLCLIMQGMLTEDGAERNSGHVQYAPASAAH